MTVKEAKLAALLMLLPLLALAALAIFGWHNDAQAQHTYLDPSPAGQECAYARLYDFANPQPLPPGCTAIGGEWNPDDGAQGVVLYVCPVINEGRCQ